MFRPVRWVNEWLHKDPAAKAGWALLGGQLVLIVFLTVGLTVAIVNSDTLTPTQIETANCLEADRVTLLGTDGDGTSTVVWADGETVDAFGRLPEDIIGLPAEVAFPGDQAADIRKRGQAALDGDPVVIEAVVNDVRVITTAVAVQTNLLAFCTTFPDGAPAAED